MVWGSGNFKSCDSLLNRIENDDSQLIDLVILPMKTFGGKEVKRLAEILNGGKNTTLKSISASGHKIPQDALEILGLAIASQNGNKIASIAIGDEKMGDVGVVSFCKGLKDMSGGSLESIDFALKGISEKGVEMIGEAFGASSNLQTLILYRNPGIGDDGLNAFCRAALESASRPFPALQKLDLSDCDIGMRGVKSLVSCLLGKVEDISEIEETRLIDLNLNSNPIGSDSCTSLKNLISVPLVNHSMLQSLSLKGCSIGDDGIEIISHVLREQQCRHLTTFDLSNNGIGLKGSSALAKALLEGRENIKELKEICMADNPIGEDGITALANSLAQHQNDQSNSVLAVLDLSNTNCGSGGATALMKCSSLSSLRLFNNNLGSDGIEAISSHLVGGHAYLKHLDLGGNRAEGNAISQLLTSIMTKQDNFKNLLVTLELGGNENSDESLFEKVKAARPELDIARDRETPKDLPDQEGSQD